MDKIIRAYFSTGYFQLPFTNGHISGFITKEKVVYVKYPALLTYGPYSEKGCYKLQKKLKQVPAFCEDNKFTSMFNIPEQFTHLEVVLYLFQHPELLNTYRIVTPRQYNQVPQIVVDYITMQARSRKMLNNIAVKQFLDSFANLREERERIVNGDAETTDLAMIVRKYPHLLEKTLISQVKLMRNDAIQKEIKNVRMNVLLDAIVNIMSGEQIMLTADILNKSVQTDLSSFLDIALFMSITKNRFTTEDYLLQAGAKYDLTGYYNLMKTDRNEIINYIKPMLDYPKDNWRILYYLSTKYPSLDIELPEEAIPYCVAQAIQI